MNRRGFLKFLGAGAAAGVAVRTFPFRVYSFPSEIKRYTLADLGAYLEWDHARECWYLSPEQKAALEDLLPQPIALRRSTSMFEYDDRLFLYGRAGSELGRGSASSWQKASTYSELDRHLAAGYELPPGFYYDGVGRRLHYAGHATQAIRLGRPEWDKERRPYLLGEWKGELTNGST